MVKRFFPSLTSRDMPCGIPDPKDMPKLSRAASATLYQAKIHISLLRLVPDEYCKLHRPRYKNLDRRTLPCDKSVQHGLRMPGADHDTLMVGRAQQIRNAWVVF